MKTDYIDSLLDGYYYEDEAYLSSSIAKKIKKVAPQLDLIPTLKEKKPGITDPLIIVSDNEGRAFCENLACALTITFAPCQVISIDQIDQLSDTKLLIGWDMLLQEKKLPIKEIPQQKEYYLNEIPFILMPHLFYQKDPLEKKTLWNKLCRKISSLLP